MATSLSGVLANIPGLAGYYAKDQLNREQTQQELAQVSALSQLQSQLASQQRAEAARQALAGLGPNATEDQRVQALLPHIGDPDKIAGILQNASLRKAQQEQTKQIAMTRLEQNARQHLDNLAVKIQNAKTAEERSHWERQVAEAQTGFRQQAADIAAGRYNHETGMTIPSLPRPFVPGAVGASPAQVAPTPAPTPSAAPAPSAAPGGAIPGPMMDSSGLAKLTPDQLAMGIQETIVNGGQFPNDPAHKAAYDSFVSEAKRRGMSVNAPFPQAAPSAAVPAPTAAPQAAPQPAPQPAPASVQIPPDIARLPKKLQDKWLAEQGRKEGGTDEAMKKAAYNAGLKEIAQDEKSLASVNQLESSLKRWRELNGQVETGRAVGMRPGIGQPLFQEMLRLQNDLAVNNFKPGQGQISNFERQLIKGAGPQVTNDKEANDNIVNVMLGAVQNARERGMFREAYLEKNKNLIGADKVWNEYIEKSPRFVSGPNGSLVPNQNRKDWTTLIGGAPQVQAQPASDGWSVRVK